MFLPAALANNDGSPAEDSEFTILHCNNPTSMKAEMKVEVSSMFLLRNGGLDATWADGFTEETVGDSTIYTKIIIRRTINLQIIFGSIYGYLII